MIIGYSTSFQEKIAKKGGSTVINGFRKSYAGYEVSSIYDRLNK